MVRNETHIVAPPIASTLAFTVSPLLTVPKNTLSPGVFLTSLDSPDNELSSKAPSEPQTMIASAGGVAPRCIRTTSPISRKLASTFWTLEPGMAETPVESESPFSRSSLWELGETVSSKDVVLLRRRASVGRSEASADMASAVRVLLYASRTRPEGTSTRLKYHSTK